MCIGYFLCENFNAGLIIILGLVRYSGLGLVTVNFVSIHGVNEVFRLLQIHQYSVLKCFIALNTLDTICMARNPRKYC